jgi:hypothetical protein
MVTNSNPTEFISDIMTVIEYLNKWFRANSLSINSEEKKHFILFATENGPQNNLDVSYANETTFLKHMTQNFLDYLCEMMGL